MTDANQRNEAKFHADRLTGIGGADAPVILGLSPFLTPLQLWAVKTGAIESALNYDKLVGDSPQLEWGRKLEPLIVQAFCDRTKRAVTTRDEDAMMVHPTIPWLIGHVDAIQTLESGEQGVLEVKNVIVYKRHRWLDEAPIEAKIQLQHYLAVACLQLGSIAGLIGGFDFRWEDVERNQRFLDGLLEKEEKFWQYVQRNIPPPAEARDVKFLNTLIPVSPKKVVHFDQSWLAVDHQYSDTMKEIERVKGTLKPLEDLRDEIEAKIKLAMGDAEEAALPGGVTFTFKQVDRKAYEVKATSYRTLRRKGEQGNE